MKYADAQRAKDANRPLAVEEVPPSVWAQTWTDRPREPVMIGLRSLAEVVLSEIAGAAQTHANTFAPGLDERSAIWAAEYSAAVRRISLGRAMCQPDHADLPWFGIAPELESAQAFSPEGAAWLFARLDAAIVGRSVLASEEDPAELAARVMGASGGAADLSPARRSQVARHLRAALDVLQGG